MAVNVVVDYQWRPVHHVNGCSANQKSTRKTMPTQQDVALKNLTPGDSLASSWISLSMDGHNAVDNSQCLNLGHAEHSASEQEASDADHKVPLEMVLPAELAKVGHVDSKDLAEQEEGANECKTSIGPGVAGEMKDSVKGLELPMRAYEDNGVFPVQQLFDRIGSDSQFSPYDVLLSVPVLDGDCINSIAEGRNCEQGSSDSMALVANSHAENPCYDSHNCPLGAMHLNCDRSIAFVDVVHRGLKASDDDLPSRCAAPLPIFEEDRSVALDSSSGVADYLGPKHCKEPKACSSIGELRRNIAEMRSQFEAVRSRSASLSPLPTSDWTPDSGGGVFKSNHQRSKREEMFETEVPMAEIASVFRTKQDGVPLVFVLKMEASPRLHLVNDRDVTPAEVFCSCAVLKLFWYTFGGVVFLPRDCERGLIGRRGRIGPMLEMAAFGVLSMIFAGAQGIFVLQIDRDDSDCSSYKMRPCCWKMMLGC
ncbi:hypothetical protein Nepgr_021109 [Nepenthes gracilis]|uniref:Uncharacterized protein n=1 Tax=Nepenthes gracilis TaxID=150966 RepID=A0AAD3SXE9_NEPGR|nr:hypothetical protein Nepgr_021109 [Nepenthes gracilis]